MKKKCNLLAICSFAIALAIFIFSYFLFHYSAPDGGFSAVFREEPAKPYLSLLFSIWGVHFLFASVMSFLVGQIFYKEQ